MAVLSSVRCLAPHWLPNLMCRCDGCPLNLIRATYASHLCIYLPDTRNPILQERLSLALLCLRTPATGTVCSCLQAEIDGPYTVHDMVIQPWAHNAMLSRDPPTKEWLLFHIGTGVAPTAGWSPCVEPNGSVRRCGALLLFVWGWGLVLSSLSILPTALCGSWHDWRVRTYCCLLEPTCAHPCPASLMSPQKCSC